MIVDYYAILGLPRTASDKEIKVRFIELARERHPDRYQGAKKVTAEAEFQGITEAFNVLKDPARRRNVDQLLAQPQGAKASEAAQVSKAYVTRGIEAYQKKRFPEALDMCTRATEQDPDNARAWYYLAMIRGRQERWTRQAVQAISRACELDSMNPTYLKLSGRLHLLAGMNQKAKKFYDEALNWGGDDPEVLNALADLEKSKKDKTRSFFGG